MKPIEGSEVFERLTGKLPYGRLPWVGTGLQAAVLAALTREEQPRVLLGRRASHLRLHPGEVAFPGGKREAQDESPWTTALREAQEEVSISPDLVTPLGELDSLVTRFGFEVHPCIASVPAELDLLVDPAEFDSVFMPSLAVFADPELFRLEQMSDGEHTRMVPHYQLGEDNVWGVTAAVLAQLANIAYDAGFDLKRDWKKSP